MAAGTSLGGGGLCSGPRRAVNTSVNFLSCRLSPPPHEPSGGGTPLLTWEPVGSSACPTGGEAFGATLKVTF